MLFSSTDCARARESVSAQLDGELPEIELDRLELHLLVCPDCATWAAEVRDMTGTLRGAVLEEPAECFVPARRSRRWAVSGSVALASAAAVVATMFVAPGQHTSIGQQHESASRFATPETQQVMVPRVPALHRLEDGLYTPVSAIRDTQGRFRPL